MKLRFDGIYSYSFFVHGVNEMRTKFLRFYPDGTLIYVIVNGMINPPDDNWSIKKIDLEKINTWFNKNSLLGEKDVFTSYIVMENIFFDLYYQGLNKKTVLQYQGTINENDQLILINIGEDKFTPDFYKMLEYKKGNQSVETIFDFNKCDIK